MKVSVQDFFQEFYDSQVFHPTIAGQDMKWSYVDTAYDSIVKTDKLFSSVDKDVFRKEMIAVSLEMIGLVFTHNVKNKERLLNQSLFTKDYLSNNAQSEIWDIMGEYNQAIAQSSTEIAKGERAQRAITAGINYVRFALFKEYMKKYYKEGMDETCITRVCNREGCDVAWKEQITVKRLTARLADRIECNENINQEALLLLTSAIWGFYQGAKEAMKSVKFN